MKIALHSFKLDLNGELRSQKISKAIVQRLFLNRLTNQKWLHAVVYIRILNIKPNYVFYQENWSLFKTWTKLSAASACWLMLNGFLALPPISCVGVFVWISSERPDGDGWGATEWSLARQKPRPDPDDDSEHVRGRVNTRACHPLHQPVSLLRGVWIDRMGWHSVFVCFDNFES